MPVLYGKFEMPEKIRIDEATSTYARFRAEPFEPGFGHTIGNALRRMLLSSLEAPAIAGFRIEGVPHEYTPVEGVVEDMTNIALNFKGALLRRLAMEGEVQPRAQKILTTELEVTNEDLKNGGGQYRVKLSDIVKSSDYELVNPDLPLFTVTQPMKRRIDVRIATGRGYRPTERLTIDEPLTDEILIDALFSPVRLVNYTVENTRVGQDTDFDRLVLEVTTDGRVTPQEALSFSAQIGLKHLNAFQEIEAHDLVFQSADEGDHTGRDAVVAKLSQSIEEMELSVRSANCLNGAGIQFVGELVVMKEPEMLQFRNFGKKSLGEIREKLEEFGLGFDMEVELAEMGIRRDNVKELIENHIAERNASMESLGIADFNVGVERDET